MVLFACGLLFAPVLALLTGLRRPH